MNLGRVFNVLASITMVMTIGTMLAPVSAHAQDAATVYGKRCAACHGTNGKGDGPAGIYLNPKPSDFAVSLKGKSDDWIAKSIKGGGSSVGESPVMPPYPDLSDAQVKMLVQYIKGFSSGS